MAAKSAPAKISQSSKRQKPVASIFSKPAASSASNGRSNGGTSRNPEKEVVEEEEDNDERRLGAKIQDEEEGEDELDDEAEDEQEGQAAVKLYVDIFFLTHHTMTLTEEIRASIFTKNFKAGSVADKGWKDGEACVD